MYDKFVTIRHFAYLKKPIYKWTLENTDGGSFSNSGEFRTLNGCFEHFFAMNPNVKRDETPVNVYAINADGTETRVGGMRLSEVKL